MWVADVTEVTDLTLGGADALGTCAGTFAVVAATATFGEEALALPVYDLLFIRSTAGPVAYFSVAGWLGIYWAALCTAVDTCGAAAGQT